MCGDSCLASLGDRKKPCGGVSSARRWKCYNPIYSHRHTLSDKYAPGSVTLDTHILTHLSPQPQSTTNGEKTSRVCSSCL